MKVEVAVLGSLSLTVLTVSVDIKEHWKLWPNAELRGCVKVHVAVLGSPSCKPVLNRANIFASRT